MADDLNELHWLSIKKRIIFKLALLVFKSLHGLAPPYLQDLFRYIPHGNRIRLQIPPTNSKLGSRAFSVIGPKIFNSLFSMFILVIEYTATYLVRDYEYVILE